MHNGVAIDMKITCLVDDRAPSGSGYTAEHGASFLIESAGRHVLFDTGQSGSALLHNLAALGMEPDKIEALIISHAHNDHTGGLPTLLEQVSGLPLYAHPDLFRERFRKTDTGPKQVGPALDRETLAKLVNLQLDAEPVEVIPGVWTTGEISSRPESEGRSSYHIVYQRNKWIADPYRDDLSVVLKTGSGLALVCGCCHAGLLNTLAHVRRVFGHVPLTVVGGTHLIHLDAPAMNSLVEKLKQYGPPQLRVSHCTGDRGFLALKVAFGDSVSLCQAGTEIQV